jgi:hypothetical protein
MPLQSHCILPALRQKPKVSLGRVKIPNQLDELYDSLGDHAFSISAQRHPPAL